MVYKLYPNNPFFLKVKLWTVITWGGVGGSERKHVGTGSIRELVLLFLIWVLVTLMGSRYDNSLSCMYTCDVCSSPHV